MVWLRWMDGGVVGGCGVGMIGIVDGACGMDAGWSWGLGGFWDAAGDCAVADCGVGRDGVAVAVVVWLGCLVLVWRGDVMMCALTDVRMAVWYGVAVGLVGARRRGCAVCECGVGGGGGVWVWFGWDVGDGMG